MMDQRRRANALYVDPEKAQAQMDFYKSIADAAKKAEQNSK